MKHIRNSLILIVPFLSWIIISFIQMNLLPRIERFEVNPLELILNVVGIIALTVLCLSLLYIIIFESKNYRTLMGLIVTGLTLSILAFFVPTILFSFGHLTLRLEMNSIFLIVYYVTGVVILVYKMRRLE